MNYEAAWGELKSWLDDQQGYIVIPVAMVKARINEAEDFWEDNDGLHRSELHPLRQEVHAVRSARS